MFRKQFLKLRDRYLAYETSKVAWPNADFDQPIVRYHFVYEGKVQDVGFRKIYRLLAQQRQLTGWVKNHPERTDQVEGEVQGSLADIATLDAYITKRMPRLKITAVQYTPEAVLPDEKTFQVIKL
ncbi:acylphosphatase [Weissella uvarum]|uniref:acylphosphatase n=1 Tax=Weissella uvarum TaxID=1479233 RepID=UPI0019604665|nr:acylphosphatase [Weissella uvarum]MBM7617425.1 acylphosphatase [Weissella uvarum]MCM0595690.1 acylphosphatase [Weissella uvarum]